MKKISLIIGIVLFILAVGIGGILIFKERKTTSSSVPTGAKPEAEVEIALEDRPYVTLTPRSDGREFTLEISRIKNAQTIEYELVYESQGLSRGVIGSVDLNGETAISRKLLLGTCSRNVCKYDEGVEEGTLTLRFRGPEGTKKFTSEFHLQQGGQELTSLDSQFKLTGKFSPTTFYITMPTIGLPEEIEGNVFGQPYGVFTAGSSLAKNSTLTITLDEVPSEAKLFIFDGEKLLEQEEIEIENNVLTARVDSLGTFFVTE